MTDHQTAAPVGGRIDLPGGMYLNEDNEIHAADHEHLADVRFYPHCREMFAAALAPASADTSGAASALPPPAPVGDGPLPCPFCGVASTISHPARSLWSVGCEAEECAINPFASGSNRTVALHEWNTRAAPPADRNDALSTPPAPVALVEAVAPRPDYLAREEAEMRPFLDALGDRGASSTTSRSAPSTSTAAEPAETKNGCEGSASSPGLKELLALAICQACGEPAGMITAYADAAQAAMEKLP